MAVYLMKKILLLSALKIESFGVIKILRLKRKRTIPGIKTWRRQTGNCEITLGITGVGLEKTRKTAGEIINYCAPSLIINFGTAGALTETMKNLKVIFPAAIKNEQNETLAINSYLLNQIAYNFTGVDLPNTTLLSCKKSVNSGKIRRRLRRHHSAHAVDMEAYEIARIAAEKNIPFFSIKVVSDKAAKFALVSFFLNLKRINTILAKTIDRIISDITEIINPKS